MIDGVKPYSEYKDSGVQWLGEVPAHWTIGPGFSVFREKKVKNTGMIEDQVLSLSYGKIVIKPKERLHGLVPASFETYQIVDPNDIIIRPTDLQNDWTSLRVGIARDRGIITSAYMCLRAIEPTIPEYGYLLLHAYDLKKIFYGMGSGLRQNLDFSDLKRMPVLTPPVDEQRAIARFLDHIDRVTRRYIRAQRRLIELLEEQKRALIQRAVTRGLDPDVPLKDSGIEWLGRVPEHWRIARLKNLLVGQLTNGLFKKKEHFGSGVPLINVSDVYQNDLHIHSEYLELVQASSDEIETFRVRPGDIFFVRSSLKLEGTARSAYIANCEQDTVFECHLVRARPDKSKVKPLFLIHYLNAPQVHHQFISRVNTVTMSTLPQGMINSLEVILPPLDEQEVITKSIQNFTQSLHTAIEYYNHQIDLVREYRTRLIADVVTGKLDVRDVVLPDPEPDDAADFADLDVTEDEGDIDDAEN